MKVFGSSGIVDLLSDRMYVHIILLSGCIDRRSRYKPSYHNSQDKNTQ